MVFQNKRIHPYSYWDYTFVVILSWTPVPWRLVSLFFSIFQSAKSDEGKIDPALGMRDWRKWSLWGLSNPVFLCSCIVWSYHKSSRIMVESKQIGVLSWLPHLNWGKESSAAPAITRWFCKSCTGEAGRHKALSWLGCYCHGPEGFSPGLNPQAPGFSRSPDFLIASQLEAAAVVPDCAECRPVQGLEHMALDSNALCCTCREIGSTIGSVVWCAAQQTSSSLCWAVPASSVPETSGYCKRDLRFQISSWVWIFSLLALRMAHSRALVWPKSNDRRHLLTWNDIWLSRATQYLGLPFQGYKYFQVLGVEPYVKTSFLRVTALCHLCCLQRGSKNKQETLGMGVRQKHRFWQLVGNI